jgi:hypothetical protein
LLEELTNSPPVLPLLLKLPWIDWKNLKKKSLKHPKKKKNHKRNKIKKDNKKNDSSINLRCKVHENDNFIVI